MPCRAQHGSFGRNNPGDPCLQLARLELWSKIHPRHQPEDIACPTIGIIAVRRSACSDAARAGRQKKAVTEVQGRDLWIDGFNVITGLEVALSGGVILGGCDGCYRDLASMYARHHQVQETRPALSLVGAWAQTAGVRRCVWWLDRPVSNSGHLRLEMLELAKINGWDWRVELVWSPDKNLAETAEIIASSDSVILNRCQRWLNLTRVLVAERVPAAQVVDLSGG